MNLMSEKIDRANLQKTIDALKAELITASQNIASYREHFHITEEEISELKAKIEVRDKLIDGIENIMGKDNFRMACRMIRGIEEDGTIKKDSE